MNSRLRDVVLMPGHPNSAALWNALCERYDLCFVYSQSVAQAQAENVQAFDLAQFATDDVREIAASDAAQMTARVTLATPQIGNRFASAIGSGAPPSLNGRLPTWLPGYAASRILAHAIQLAALENLSSQRRIAGCVVHEDVSGDTRALVSFCKSRGIPTIHVPHANCHMLPEAGPDIHRQTRAEFIAAAGRYMRDWYIEQGHPADRIQITGAPYWDENCSEHLPLRDEARRVLRIDSSLPVICHAATWSQTTAVRGGYENEEERWIDAVLRLANDMRAITLFKIHPHAGANIEEYFVKRLEEANMPGLVTRHHMFYLIRAADVVVAAGPSNICVDAAMLGTPSCYFQTEGFDYRHALPFRGGVDELPQMARDAMASSGDPVWADFVGTYNDAWPDGNAADRTVEYIEQCLQARI